VTPAVAGRIVLVATPIGNLGDLSPRATEALATADVVCCEDTRRTRALLSAAGVPAGRRLVSLHGHNEVARIDEVLARVEAGATVAVVSDAGMPAVSDPGQRLVAAAVGAGLTVTVVPGPSAVLAALVVSGLPTDRFCVEGFLPRKGGERRRRLEALAADERTLVVLEAPGRLAATLGDLAAVAGPRPVAVVRELTKLHEEVWRGTLTDAAAVFAARPVRGEVVLVVGGSTGAGGPDELVVEAAVRARLDAGDGPRQVAEAVSAELGVGRRRAYELAITLRRSGARVDPAGR
jgi:16S rRNA (cytidine1402-2'-O)-methyltransferase